MRNTKRIVSQFTFHDRTGIQSYLERMAEKGWMLEKITKWSWIFRRIEPKRIHFAVSYFAKTSSFEPSPPEELLRFREFCEYTGWKFCAEAAQMQIFYNEAADPVPIETDAMLEIESIHKGIKKQILPSFIALGIVAVLNGSTHISSIINSPISFFRNHLGVFVLLSVSLLFLMVAIELGSYFIWRARALKAAKRDGSFIPTRGNRILLCVLLYILLAAFVLLILSEWNSYISKALVIVLAYYFALLLLVHGISDIMKRKKVGAGANVTVTIILAFVLSFAIVGVATWTVTKLGFSDNSEDAVYDYVLAPDEEYTHNGYVYTKYNHELPLYPSDIFDMDEEIKAEGYSNEKTVYDSVFLHQELCYSSALAYIIDAPDIHYGIIDVKMPFLTEHIFNSVVEHFKGTPLERSYEYRSSDPTPWNADSAYKVCSTYSTYEGTEYLIRWGERILTISCSEAIDEAQIAVIVEKIGK